MNNGQPTRFKVNNPTYAVQESWLDWTICGGIIKDLYKWRVREMDMISVHYQIWMTIAVGRHYREDDFVPDVHWKLSRDPEKWSHYGRLMSDEWDSLQHRVENYCYTECCPGD